MSDIELDTMIERDAERQWEEENPPAPANPIESLSTDDRIHAHSCIDTAGFLLTLVLGDIEDAQKTVNNTPQGDKLGGLYDQLSDLAFDLKNVSKEVWGK